MKTLTEELLPTIRGWVHTEARIEACMLIIEDTVKDMDREVKELLDACDMVDVKAKNNKSER